MNEEPRHAGLPQCLEAATKAQTAARRIIARTMTG